VGSVVRSALVVAEQAAHHDPAHAAAEGGVHVDHVTGDHGVDRAVDLLHHRRQVPVDAAHLERGLDDPAAPVVLGAVGDDQRGLAVHGHQHLQDGSPEQVVGAGVEDGAVGLRPEEEHEALGAVPDVDDVAVALVQGVEPGGQVAGEQPPDAGGVAEPGARGLHGAHVPATGASATRPVCRAGPAGTEPPCSR